VDDLNSIFSKIILAPLTRLGSLEFELEFVEIFFDAGFQFFSSITFCEPFGFKRKRKILHQTKLLKILEKSGELCYWKNSRQKSHSNSDADFNFP